MRAKRVRRRTGIMRRINKFNEWLAVKTTLALGTMWATYGFVTYGLLPLIFPSKMNQILYWSNVIQLCALSLVMVGQNVLNRAAERRAIQDHNTLMNQLKMEREELIKLNQIIEIQAQIIDRLQRFPDERPRDEGDSHGGEDGRGDPTADPGNQIPQGKTPKSD